MVISSVLSVIGRIKLFSDLISMRIFVGCLIVIKVNVEIMINLIIMLCEFFLIFGEKVLKNEIDV